MPHQYPRITTMDKEQTREKASELLTGALFSHIDEDGEIVLVKDGREIMIGAFRGTLSVAYGSDVVYISGPHRA